MEYTFRGSNSIISLFCLPFHWDTPLGEATLPFVCFASLFNGVHLQGKQLYHLFVLPPFTMEYTFRRSNSTICLFCLPFQWGTPSGETTLPFVCFASFFNGGTLLGEATLPFVCFASLFNGSTLSGEATLPFVCFASLFNGVPL